MKKTLITLALSLSLMGCGGTYHREYNVTDDFKIYIEDYTQISERWREIKGKEGRNVLGFWQTKNGKQYLYVPKSGYKDINGNELPNFETLGHEIWHLKELGGHYHE